jgi:diacylglycerol kinase family enzyme
MADHPVECEGAPDGLHQEIRTACVLVNRRAGAVLEVGKEHFAERLKAEFAKCRYDACIFLLEPHELSSAFNDCVGSSSVDLVVIAGGDGSMSAILPDLMRTGVPIAVLPLGTVNLIGRDLGATGDLAVDVARIANGRVTSVDVVMINNTPFHSIAGLGWFVKMAAERQAARSRFPLSRHFGLAWAALKTILLSRSVDVDYRTPDLHQVVRADAVLVTNNRFFGSERRRPRLDEGLFEMHIIQASSIWLRLKVLVRLLQGTWRDSENLMTVQATEAILKRRGRTRLRIAIDGELRRLQSPLRIRIVPGMIKLVMSGPHAGD